VKCRHVRKMLADYVNGVLGQEDSRVVQEHVAECDSCHRELDALRKVLRLMDDVKVEYPPASVWENFLPDLHSRIESEAALAFRKQHRQRLYLLPGWVASAAAVVLALFASVILRYYPPAPSSIQLRAPESVRMVEGRSPSAVEHSSEPVLVAGVISEVLISEEEAAKLKKLRSFIQSETLMLPHYYDDVLVDMSEEASGTEDDEGFIQFLLENGFVEFDESSMVESDVNEFGTM
jgi:hypothetical protein